MWEKTLYELICRTSVDLPADVQDALRKALAEEEPHSNAAEALKAMLNNVEKARTERGPLCQDTGTLIFRVCAPPDVSPVMFRRSAEAAIVRATQDGLLRQNCVQTLTGRNTGNNLGRGAPVIHWETMPEGEVVSVSLLLKGGGCENVGAQYSLPDTRLGAGRDLDGVRRCVLDAVHQAQGNGCAPGILGIAVGGDRATGYEESKRQLFRRIGERHADPQLSELETRLKREVNSLGIGPMGFGGRTTVLDVFIGVLDRLPASYFVSMSYMCWAFRRRTVQTTKSGAVLEWTN